MGLKREKYIFQEEGTTNMEKFCPNCGTPIKEGANSCGGCGAKRPDAAGQPAQQTQQTQQTQQPQYAPPIPEQKKKSKAPFFIGGGVVIAAALVVTLIFTNVFGLLNQTGDDKTDISGGSNTNSESGVAAREDGEESEDGEDGEDGEDSYYYFDWETIEMFGGVEGFAEWLRYGLELDAEDYYETVNGVYFMSPVERVDIERGWLDGYPVVKD